MSKALGTKIRELALENESYVVEMRREFHMYPEASLKEERTSARIQEELAKLGVPFEVLSNRTVIATIEGGAKGRTLAIRADIDALSIQEENDVPYKSKTDGVMHACGHDAHAAMLLGTARMLAEIKESLKGTVKLVFHVAEEIGLGYREILDYFERTGGVDGIIATHVWVALKAGTVSIEAGPRMAGAIPFALEVTGRGGHGSRPDQSVSPIFPLCDIVMKLPYVPQYFHNALEPSVVSVGIINSGTMRNTIPDQARADGGIRYFTQEAKKSIIKYITRIAENTAEAYGAKAEVVFGGGIAPVVNDGEAVRLAREAAEETEGLGLVPFELICASDCYGMILEKYPGCYCFLGVGNEDKGIVHPQHSVKYDIDESVMKLNCELMCRYAQKFFS